MDGFFRLLESCVSFCDVANPWGRLRHPKTAHEFFVKETFLFGYLFFVPVVDTRLACPGTWVAGRHNAYQDPLTIRALNKRRHLEVSSIYGQNVSHSVNFSELLCNKLSLARRWAEVLSMALFVQILNNSQIQSPWLGDKVVSGIGLSYRPARLPRLAGRYDNPLPDSTISLIQGLWIWLQVWPEISSLSPDVYL